MLTSGALSGMFFSVLHKVGIYEFSHLLPHSLVAKRIEISPVTVSLLVPDNHADHEDLTWARFWVALVGMHLPHLSFSSDITLHLKGIGDSTG